MKGNKLQLVLLMESKYIFEKLKGLPLVNPKERENQEQLCSKEEKQRINIDSLSSFIHPYMGCIRIFLLYQVFPIIERLKIEWNYRKHHHSVLSAGDSSTIEKNTQSERYALIQASSQRISSYILPQICWTSSYLLWIPPLDLTWKFFFIHQFPNESLGYKKVITSDAPTICWCNNHPQRTTWIIIRDLISFYFSTKMYRTILTKNFKYERKFA